MTDLDYIFGEDASELDQVRGRDTRVRGTRSAGTTLAAWALADALAPHTAALAAGRSVALVVGVPGADWVDPVRKALNSFAHFDSVLAKSGESRDDRPEKGNAAVAEALAKGERVAGVSQAPTRHLPVVLTQCADVHVTIPPPSDDLVSRVVRAATGRRPRGLPRGVARTLGYGQLVSAIRLGATAGATATRLAAAASAQVAADPTVADATPFEDLRGYGKEFHEWGTELVASVNAWRRGELTTDRISGRAALWAGPPGTGKTTAARSLAKSLGLPLRATSVGAWFSSTAGYLDSVVKAVDAVVDQALAGPCVVLLDEIEALPKREGLDGRSASWWIPVVTHCLLRFEELLTQRKTLVVVVAATNHPERVDPALTRPGRLDRVITVGLPSLDDLVHVLRQHLGTDLPDVDLTPVAHLAAGSTGAAVAGYVARARTRALVARRTLDIDDLTRAVAPATERSPELHRLVAVHEAGHAVLIEALGRGPVTTVSTVPRDGAAGLTARERLPEELATRADVEAEVVCVLAGRAAETVFIGRASVGAGGHDTSDLASATKIVASLHASFGLAGSLRYRGDPDDMPHALQIDPVLARAVEDDLRRLQAEAVRLVETHRDAVERVVDFLLARRVIDGPTLRRAMAGTDAAPDRIGPDVPNPPS